MRITNKPKEKKFTFRLTEEEHNEIMKYCDEEDITASQMIRIYFKKLINEKNNIHTHTI